MLAQDEIKTMAASDDVCSVGRGSRGACLALVDEEDNMGKIK
jgi:hypothetical protein